MAVSSQFLSLAQFDERYGVEKPYHEYWSGEALPKATPSSMHGIHRILLVARQSSPKAAALKQQRLRVAEVFRLSNSVPSFPYRCQRDNRKLQP